MYLFICITSCQLFMVVTFDALVCTFLSYIIIRGYNLMFNCSSKVINLHSKRGLTNQRWLSTTLCSLWTSLVSETWMLLFWTIPNLFLVRSNFFCCECDLLFVFKCACSDILSSYTTCNMDLVKVNNTVVLLHGRGLFVQLTEQSIKNALHPSEIKYRRLSNKTHLLSWWQQTLMS